MNINNEDMVTVTPVYGFGWMTGETNKPMKVPEPLTILIIDRGEPPESTYVIGRVISETHPLKDLIILLTMRGRESGMISWNVRVYENTTTAYEMIRGEKPTPICTGFAETKDPNEQ